MLGKSGFSLIEALVAVLISMIVVIGIATMLGFFPIYVRDRTELSCLVEAANSGINACRAGIVINSIECGSMNVNITIEGSCTPPKGECNEIRATATLGERSFSLRDVVCGI